MRENHDLFPKRNSIALGRLFAYRGLSFMLLPFRLALKGLDVSYPGLIGVAMAIYSLKFICSPGYAILPSRSDPSRIYFEYPVIFKHLIGDYDFTIAEGSILSS